MSPCRVLGLSAVMTFIGLAAGDAVLAAGSLRVAMVTAGMGYWLPDDALLGRLYGPNWKASDPARFLDLLRSDEPAARRLRELAAMSSRQVVVQFHHPGGRAVEAARTTTGTTLIVRPPCYDPRSQMVFMPYDVTPVARRYAAMGYPFLMEDNGLVVALVHELTHGFDGTLDDVATALSLYHRSHYPKAVTNEFTAWVEGWAEYNMCLFGPSSRRMIMHSLDHIETPHGGEPWISDHQLNEGAVAALLLFLESKSPARRRAIDVSFAATDGLDQTPMTFLEHYVTTNRADRHRAALLYDALFCEFDSGVLELQRLLGDDFDDYAERYRPAARRIWYDERSTGTPRESVLRHVLLSVRLPSR